LVRVLLNLIVFGRCSHVYNELRESEKELRVLEKELQEIDHIERDLQELTHERELLHQVMRMVMRMVMMMIIMMKLVNILYAVPAYCVRSLSLSVLSQKITGAAAISGTGDPTNSSGKVRGRVRRQ
jgi:uncharacterized membrane protein